MSSKYMDSMKLLTNIEQGTHQQKPAASSHEKQLIKTLTRKGYIERTINRINGENYSITEKGAETLQEYEKINKILEKIREGIHPSTGHRDR